MQELTPETARNRAEQLIEEWRSSHGSARKTRDGLGDAVLISESLLKYVPYLLATLYYSMGLLEKAMKKSTGKRRRTNVLRFLTDQTIETVIEFAPVNEIDAAECKQDLATVVQDLGDTLSTEDRLVENSDALARRIFSVLRRYCPQATDRDRELVRYLVDAELRRLSR